VAILVHDLFRAQGEIGGEEGFDGGGRFSVARLCGGALS
jgi:hypothetical protein